jgi:hypothetical protein
LIRYIRFMSNPLNWHKFWYRRWSSDEFVKLADLETLGAYIVLITHQMDQGGTVPSDPEELATLIGHKITTERFLFLWNDRKLSTKFSPADERWVITGDQLDDGYWESDEAQPGRLHNRFTTKVMTVDQKTRNGKVKGGQKSAEVRAARALEESLADPEETPVFDFTELLRIMPKRKKNNQLQGWDKGKVALKYITTQDEYDRLMAATRVYARERRGEDPAYHIGLDKWVTEKHHDHVPANFQAPAAPPTPTAVAAEKPAEPVRRNYPPMWLAPSNPARHLKPGETPPWVVDAYDLAGRERARLLFPDDDSKRRWWMTSESEPVQAGA